MARESSGGEQPVGDPHARAGGGSESRPEPGTAKAPAVRPARRRDVERVAWLMYESASQVYDRYAGTPRAALRLLRAAFRRSGTTASAEVVTVAELEGEVVGVIAAFPVAEAHHRTARFLRVTFARVPPWRWPTALRIFRLGAAAAAPPPHDALYVDALATDPAARRRGVATALLAAAERRAREEGFPRIALDTESTNETAQALYRCLGLTVTASLP